MAYNTVLCSRENLARWLFLYSFYLRNNSMCGGKECLRGWRAIFLVQDSLCVETVCVVESAFCLMQNVVVRMSGSREKALSRTKHVSRLFIWLFLGSVQVQKPSYSRGCTIKHLGNAGKSHVALSHFWSNISHRLVWLASQVKSQKVLNVSHISLASPVSHDCVSHLSRLSCLCCPLPFLSRTP